MSTPGLRNHNPGNIEYDGTPWQGLDDPPSDGRFCRFKAPSWGIRAIARNLITYQDKRQAADGSKIDTVREIFERYAPPSDKNDTASYAAHVRQKLGVAEGEIIDVHRYEIMRPLVETIILHENGSVPYSGAQIDKGLVLAGVEPPEKPLSKSRTVRGGQVAGAGVTLTALAEGVQNAAYQFQSLSYYLETFKWVFIGLTILGIGISLYARLDDRKKGLR